MNEQPDQRGQAQRPKRDAVEAWIVNVTLISLFFAACSAPFDVWQISAFFFAVFLASVLAGMIWMIAKQSRFEIFHGLAALFLLCGVMTLAPKEFLIPYGVVNSLLVSIGLALGSKVAGVIPVEKRFERLFSFLMTLVSPYVVLLLFVCVLKLLGWLIEWRLSTMSGVLTPIGYFVGILFGLGVLGRTWFNYHVNRARAVSKKAIQTPTVL